MPACPTAAHFTTHFAALPDPRVERTKRHQLIDILVIALCATLCGADDFVAITDWGRAKRNWLQERLGLELKNGVPSHDTFGRVFARLDPHAFAQCFVAWTQAVKTHTKGQVIALDGKQLRHSFDTASNKAALHLVSAGLGVGCQESARGGPSQSRAGEQRDNRCAQTVGVARHPGLYR